jgi:hypothetical protein
MEKTQQTDHAARKTACHHGKAKEKHQACSPDEGVAGEAAFAREPLLVDKVDGYKTDDREDPWHPIKETDVDRDGVVWCVLGWLGVGGEDCGVKKDPERGCELD